MSKITMHSEQKKDFQLQQTDLNKMINRYDFHR
jgi:hypothetical protein